MTPDTAALVQLGLDRGLDAVGVAPAEPFTSTRDTLLERRAAGLHAGMQFTYRNPDRSTDPGRIVPGARALVVGARGYPPPALAHRQGPVGRVAAYAVDDHYAQLRSALAPIADALTDAGYAARVVADDNALVDREAAYRAGLGWYGKNANLLLPGRGSWFVLGSVVTDAPLEPSSTPVADGCGSCQRCLTGCPTGAIVAPGVVDARRCLAWLLQATGDFPREHRIALGTRIYGCDDCQEVCPKNRDAPAPQGDDTVDLVELLDLDDEQILAAHGRWYVPARDPRYVRRNALVALGNSGSGREEDVERVLVSALDGDDEMLRRHAAWAAQRLGRHDLLADRLGDPAVAAEVATSDVLAVVER